MSIDRRTRNGRVFRLLVMTLILIWFPIGALIASIGRPIEEILLLILPVLPVIVGLVWAWLRVWWVGVFLESEMLVARSWWRTRSYSRSSIRRATGVLEEGWFYILCWPVVSGSLQSGVVQLQTQDNLFVLDGSLTSLGSARAEAERVNRWLGLDVGAGEGPRRRRSQYE